MIFYSGSETETFEYASKFAKALKGGEVIGLTGNLGAGKTVFTRGLAAGLGIRRKITSPTFVFMKNYQVSRRAIKEFVHIDAYRIKQVSDVAGIGLNEYFNRSDAIIVIEWADKIKKIMPKRTKFFSFKIKANGRQISS